MKKRKRRSLLPLQHQGIIALEFFGLAEVHRAALYKSIKRNPYCLMLHTTQNGQGVFLVRVDPIPRNGMEHQKAFQSCTQLFQPTAKEFGITIRPLKNPTDCIVEEVEMDGEKGYIWNSPVMDSPYRIKKIGLGGVYDNVAKMCPMQRDV